MEILLFKKKKNKTKRSGVGSVKGSDANDKIIL